MSSTDPFVLDALGQVRDAAERLIADLALPLARSGG